MGSLPIRHGADSDPRHSELLREQRVGFLWHLGGDHRDLRHRPASVAGASELTHVRTEWQKSTAKSVKTSYGKGRL